MTIAAFCASLVAIVVSISSALFTRRNALAQETSAQAELDRRHDERTPHLTVTGARHDHLEPPRLYAVFLNSSSLDLDAVHVDIISAPMDPNPLVELKAPAGAEAGDLGTFKVGQERRFECHLLDDDKPARGLLRITCAAGREQWVYPLEVTWECGPVEPMISVV